MTLHTIRWISLSSVVRVRGAVEITHVASVALGRGTSVAVGVALDATRARMLAGQGEAGVVMVKGGRDPCRRVVTLGTIRWEPSLYMVRCRGGVVVRDVARRTVRWCSGETTRMALHAVHRGMRTHQGETSIAVIKGCRVPSAFVVAHGTVHWESGSGMVGICCICVVRQVAGLARVGRVGVARSVALVAVHVLVRACLLYTSPSPRD